MYVMEELHSEEKSQEPGTSSRYGEFGANNIVIVPTVSFTKPITPPVNTQECTRNVPSCKTTMNPNIKPEIVQEYSSQTRNTIKPIPMNLDSKEISKNISSISQKIAIDVNKNIANVEDMNKKKSSWASNYLHSIGHNNVKPVKINLSSSRIQKTDTVSTKSNESKVTQKTLLKGPSSCCQDVHITEQSVTSHPYVITGKHDNVGNLKTLHPNVKRDVNITKVPSGDIIPTSVNSSIVLNTIYTKNNNNTIAPPYETLLAKDNGKATSWYNNGKYEIDILDAIKYKIRRESGIEYNSCTMNLHTHKDMCEEFIKEIRNKPSTSEKMRDPAKSTTNSKKDAVLKKSSTFKLDAKVKKRDKTEKKNIKESLKTIVRKSDKDKLKNTKSPVENKVIKKEIKLETENKKILNNKSIMDLKDFENTTRKRVHKDPEIKQQNDKKPQKLKRVRKISGDLHNSGSENCAHSPVRSVKVVRTEKCQGNSPKRQCLETVEGFDLRSKLSRVNKRIHKKQLEYDLNKKTKQRDNLKIKVENQNDKSPKKSNIVKTKYKTKKRKLKLIINVVCEESDDDTSSSESEISETGPTQNTDLSFLDDFNVDEIVDCLKHSPNHKIKSPLPLERKLGETTEMASDPQLNIATILNILHKSESNKLKNSVKTECNIEETVISNSTLPLNQNNEKPMPEIKIEENKISIIKEENVINHDENKNATDASSKLCSQTKVQLNQQTTPIADDLLVPKCSSEVIDSNFGLINKKEEKSLSEDTDMLVLDESVIINERDISLIDLTDENFITKSSKECDNSISATSIFIQAELQNTNIDLKNSAKDETLNLPHRLLDDNLEKTSGPLINKNSSIVEINNAARLHVEVGSNILDKKQEVIIDLTVDDNPVCSNEAVQNNAIIQKQVENEMFSKKDLKSKIQTKENENNMSTNETLTECVQNVQTTIEKPVECLKVFNRTNDKPGGTNIKINAPSTSKTAIKTAKNNHVTVKAKTEVTNKENVKNTTASNKVSKPAKETININKVFSTSLVAEKLLKNIVDSVWESKKDVGTTSENNQTENQIDMTSDVTKTETVNVPKNSTIVVEKKTTLDTISGQEKALAIILEERILDYLHKEIKVVKHIRLGKYSNIFSCKDTTTGEFYAAKVLKNKGDRLTLGIQKEQMIRELQKDIPRESLNTVYLIDGFGIERFWCFLTEYYPKNLHQVLQEQSKPFHIDLVQELTRQLMSAVMMLRNNDIVHSDIKPRHILMNSTYDRLKLCGFDEAYYGNDVYPLPNIGTPPYRAPEVIIGFSASYSIDVWSSALVVYQMATGQKLINGVYNNDILYKQMCTFGSLPRDMVHASLYMNRHFHGNTFMRRVGFRGQDAVLFQKFFKTKRLHSSLIAAYNKHWMTNNAYQRDSDMFKLAGLYRLLEQMLLMDPRLRLAIEFVCVDPFIYEMFS